MLINGDCLEELIKLSSGSIDLIITDPPYFISKDSGFKNTSASTTQQMATKYNISIDFGEWDRGELDWERLMQEYWRVLKKGGTLIIFYDIWKAQELKEFADLSKFKQARVCAWTKTNPVPINSQINYLSNATEYFFTFTKGSRPTFNSKYDNGTYRYPICHGKERLEHPTQKPLSLMSDLIKKHSHKGDLVLDTFAGSCTVGHACELLNRRWICVEKEVTYFNMGLQRINRLREKGELASQQYSEGVEIKDISSTNPTISNI